MQSVFDHQFSEHRKKNLKGSYDIAKKNNMLCIWRNAHYFPHNEHYCCSSMLCLFVTRRFLRSEKQGIH